MSLYSIGRDVFSVKNLIHLDCQTIGYFLLLPLAQLLLCPSEQVVVQVKIFQLAFCMKNILLVHVDVDHVVQAFYFIRYVILDRADVVINKQLVAANISRKASYAVINRHDVRIKRVDQIVERLQRRDFPTGRYVNIGAKCADPLIRVVLRVRMNGNMALVQRHDDRFREGGPAIPRMTPQGLLRQGLPIQEKSHSLPGEHNPVLRYSKRGPR